MTAWVDDDRWEEHAGPISEVAKPIMSFQLDQIISKNEEAKL
jgi:hypothetical protein